MGTRRDPVVGKNPKARKGGSLASASASTSTSASASASASASEVPSAPASHASSASASAAAPVERRHRRWRKLAAGFTIFSVLVVGVLFVGYLPARTWLRQHRDIDEARRDLATLSDQNRRLAGEIARLQDPVEIARIARAEYSLVKKDEAAYAIIPGATTTTTRDPAITAEVTPEGVVVPITTPITRP